ncbi:MAG: RNA methyltransferase [Candidatus Kapaibacterium sp.]|nr:MAG: RNA methyltransferase [Candidatus Kapabacteria bacterium]
MPEPTPPVFITPERNEKLQRVLAKKQPSLTIVLENVHDPHNVSAVLRSCDAVGVVEAFLIYNGKQEFPELGRKSSGSAKKWIDLHQFSTATECFAALRARGYAIYTTNMANDAVSLYALNLTQPVALVFGNEHSGVSDEALALADGNFLIPQVGMIQSLNISVACAVSLFEAYRQRDLAGMYIEAQFTAEEFATKLLDWQQR